MKTLGYVFSVLFCCSLTSANAQTKHFELDNPNSIPLSNENLEVITSGYWRVYQEEVKSRETARSTPKNISLCYYPDGTFFYNGSSGRWKVLENSYIEHQLEKEAQKDLNFGGIFSVTELDDSTVTLTKLLTSSHDMQRILYLKSSTVLTRTEQPNSGAPYLYDGPLHKSTIDSLRHLDSDELFNAGFTILPDNKIHIIASDTLYVISLDAAGDQYDRVPLR